MQNCEFFNNIQIYVFKQVIKKQKTKISNVKYSSKLKKHLIYTANIETNIENIDLSKYYVKKTIVLSKNVVSEIFKFE